MQITEETSEIAKCLRNFSASDKAKLVEIIAEMLMSDVSDEKSEYQNILFRSTTNP